MLRFKLGMMAAFAAALAGWTLPASAQAIGDAAACSGHGPAIRVNVLGLRDRTGEIKLELYPPNGTDFLRDDRDLIREGKVFRRVRVPTPRSGAVQVCIAVPAPGRYALLVTHNRDGRNKFSIWNDGAGFPSNQRLGRARPNVDQALINVPAGVTTTNIVVQYLRGLGGFGPMGS